MTASVTSVVFDLGGVLIDWNPEYLYRKLIPDEQARDYFLTRICTHEWHERHDAGISFADNARALMRDYADDPATQHLIRAWGERFDGMISGSIPGTVAILTELHKAKIPLYALTNWPREAFASARRRFPFLSFFTDIVVSGEEGMIKPNPAFYQLLLKRTGIIPENALYIDREVNLVPATDLGFTSVLFTTPEALAETLQLHGLLSSSLPLQRCAL